MARGFNTTLGAGASDAVVSTLTTDVNLRSWFIWIYPRVSATQMIFGQRGTVLVNVIYESGGVWNYIRDWSTTDGQWHIAKGSNGSWHSLGMSYNAGAINNIPVFYLDGTKPAVTTDAIPSGTLTSVAGEPIRIGNRSAADLPLDGMLAEAAVWDVILTDAEFFAMNKGVSPALIRPQSLVSYVPMVRSNVDLKLAAPTITGTAVQPHPRIIKPKPRTMPWIPAETVSV